MKQTKEQLLAENAKLTAELSGMLKLDEAQRKELSSALHLPADHGSLEHLSYSNNIYRERQVAYTWPQIFVALGKLIARKDHADFVDELRDTARKASYAVGEIEGMKNKDRPSPGC